MRRSRLRGTTRDWMVAIALTGLVSAAVVTVHRDLQGKKTLADQILELEGAKAVYQNAKLTREVAEIAVTEYKEGGYGVHAEALAAARAEFARLYPEREREQAREGAEWRRRIRERGYVSTHDRTRPRAAPELEALYKTILQRLLSGAKFRESVEALQRDVEKARADELAKEKTYKKLHAAVSNLLR